MKTIYEPTPVEKKVHEALKIILADAPTMPSHDFLWHSRQHMGEQERPFLTFRVLAEQIENRPIRRVGLDGATTHTTLYRAPFDVQAFGPGADALLRWIVTHAGDPKYLELWDAQDMQLVVLSDGLQNTTVSTKVDTDPRSRLSAVLNVTITENSTSDVLKLVRLNNSNEDIEI